MAARASGTGETGSVRTAKMPAIRSWSGFAVSAAGTGGTGGNLFRKSPTSRKPGLPAPDRDCAGSTYARCCTSHDACLYKSGRCERRRATVVCGVLLKGCHIDLQAKSRDPHAIESCVGIPATGIAWRRVVLTSEVFGSLKPPSRGNEIQAVPSDRIDDARGEGLES